MDVSDCIIVGGGPAGLTGAVYLSRYHLEVQLFDGNSSRASWIPCSHNLAGYPDGISGNDLLKRMRQHAANYGVEPQYLEIQQMTRGNDDIFILESAEGLFAAGDVVVGLDQIGNAMGQAAVAATTIRNDLAGQSGLYRRA